MELIRLENITKTYHLGEVDVPVLKGISLTIQRGELVALMGASGSGKTTLMNILGCLDRPSSGNYTLDGAEISTLTTDERALVRTAKLGFVFQSFNLLPRTNAALNVLMPLDYSMKRPSRHDAHALAEKLLNRVGLGERLDHEPSQMSGGQQQRVAIARSLVNSPALVLADEPTGNLDSRTSVEILEMFQQLNAQGITVILVTHDPKVAAFASRVIRIADGLVEGDETRPAMNATHSLNGPHGLSSPNLPSPDLPSPAPLVNGNGHVDGSAVLPSAISSNGNGHGNGVAVEMVGESGGTALATLPELGTQRSTAAVASATAPTAEVSVHHQHTNTSRFGVTALLPPTLRTALSALYRNKMRSLLTALGVIIGVGAVIAISEIGNGSKKSIEKSIASMGANNVVVLPGAAASGGVSFGSGSVQTLTPDDCDEIGRQCPDIVDVAPIVRARAQVVYQNRNWNPSTLQGTTPSFLAVRDWETMDEGDIFSDNDVRNSAKVCVVGKTIQRELFQNESPVGKDIRIQNVAFRVIGVLSPKGANMMGMDQDDIVLAPWTTIKYRVSGAGAGSTTTSTTASSTASTEATSTAVNTLNNLYPNSTALYPQSSTTEQADTPQPIRFITIDQIVIKAISTLRIPMAIEEMTELLRERHKIRPGSDDDFQMRDMTEMTNTLSKTSNVMSMTLIVVAFISLVVGGVGIMNIMLVSVTERTREIGLRMAVGARGYHILRQFLVEAIMLCVAGGLIGIGLGEMASRLVRYYLHWPTQPSLLVIFISVMVSASVGIIFGFYPALKASRLDPIEALRYE